MKFVTALADVKNFATSTSLFFSDLRGKFTRACCIRNYFNGVSGSVLFKIKLPLTIVNLT